MMLERGAREASQSGGPAVGEMAVIECSAYPGKLGVRVGNFGPRLEARGSRYDATSTSTSMRPDSIATISILLLAVVPRLVI
jgi:hypothetical protein